MVWPKVKPPLRKDDPDAMCASSQDDHMVQDDQDKAFIIILIRMDDIVVKKVHLCHDQGHKHEWPLCVHTVIPALMSKCVGIPANIINYIVLLFTNYIIFNDIDSSNTMTGHICHCNNKCSTL